MEQRINQLELSVNRHDDQIAKLFAQVSDMNVHLTSIQDTLNQIKYIAVGMMVYFTLQEFGFFAAFKAASKVVA